MAVEASSPSYALGRPPICMQEAMRLYSSAIDKCDQVLEIKPRDTAVLVTFGLALKDMALCMTLDDPDVQLHLAVSTHCATTLQIGLLLTGSQHLIQLLLMRSFFPSGISPEPVMASSDGHAARH